MYAGRLLLTKITNEEKNKSMKMQTNVKFSFSQKCINLDVYALDTKSQLIRFHRQGSLLKCP